MSRWKKHPPTFKCHGSYNNRDFNYRQTKRQQQQQQPNQKMIRLRRRGIFSLFICIGMLSVLCSWFVLKGANHAIIFRELQTESPQHGHLHRNPTQEDTGGSGVTGNCIQKYTVLFSGVMECKSLIRVSCIHKLVHELYNIIRLSVTHWR